MIKNIIAMMKGKGLECDCFGCQRKTIGAHYAMSEKDFAAMTGKIIGLVLANKDKSKVLDELFPKTSAELRAKVEAYHIARMILERAE